MPGETSGSDAAEEAVVDVLCGPSFSGKSTLARRMAAMLGYDVVSADAINAGRGFVAGFETPDAEWAATHRVVLESVERLLAAGRRRVVVDDTSCFRFLRDDLREIARHHGYRCRIIVLDISKSDLSARIRGDREGARRRGLTESRFRKHLARFEWPDADEEPIAFDARADVDRWIVERLA